MNREAAIPVEELVEELAPQRRFQPYRQYRDSGVEWLAQLPAHWTIKRLKHLCLRSALYGANEPATSYEDDGVRFLRTTDITEHGDLAGEGVNLEPEIVRDYILSHGDLLISRSGTIGRAFVYDATLHGPCAYAGYLVRFVPGPRLSPRFALHFTKSKSFEHWLSLSVIASTIGNVNGQKYANMQIAHPPLDEQRAIVAFLDRETARIDELVAKKQRLIELLAEKRTALISHAVTKGLNSDAPMKDSGIDWIGRVPKHWDVLRLRRRWKVIDCKHRTVPFLHEGIPLASIGEVQGVELDLSNAKRTSEDEYRLLVENDRQPRRGDIIYSRNATVGAAAYVNTDERFCMGQDVCMIRSRDQDQWYLVYQLRSPSITSQLDQLMIGATFKRVNVADIKALNVVCPPVVEQRAIGAYCKTVSARVRRLADAVFLGIARLHEYRSALISAAVTGKIDIRQYAAKEEESA